LRIVFFVLHLINLYLVKLKNFIFDLKHELP
jgi:hypothetical protein